MSREKRDRKGRKDRGKKKKRNNDLYPGDLYGWRQIESRWAATWRYVVDEGGET